MSTYYSDPKISRREKEERESDIRGKIEQIRVEQPRTGYRPLLAELKKSGVVIGERRLRRIMKKFSLHIKPRRRFVRTTQSDHDHPVHENLIKGMEVTKINQLWVSDITYIRITNGFVYLAVVMDIYSRKVVGWAISKKIDRHLTLAALQMAIKQRAPKEGIIHHSDRGVQYLCDDYVKLLVDSGFQVSCSRKGNPYDNAFAESFMKTLKDNEVHLWSYETILDVLERVPYFIEEVYNKKRLHSALDYQSPEEFENEIKVRYKNKKSASRYVVKIGGSGLTPS